MKGNNRILSFLLICVLLSMPALGGCEVREPSAETDSAGAAAAVSAQPDTSDARTLTLEEGGETLISEGGVYRITGSVSDGRIRVCAPGEEVTLLLDNASVACADRNPLYIEKAAQVTLALAEGSVNSLCGPGADADVEEINACVYAKTDLLITGSGALTVTADSGNGIVCKDALTIASATLNVEAQNNGITGRDSLCVQSAAVTVSAGGDALRSTNDSDAALGYVTVSDSTLHLSAGEDGIQAQTALTVTGGACTVVSGGGSGVAPGDSSAKGLKGGASVTLNGGVYSLDCSDDSIHSNGSVSVLDGSYTISTGDDGIHADETVVVTGGSIEIAKCYEGIEGAVVEISGGEISIVSSDDGINAAGGADQSGFGFGFAGGFGGGRDSFGDSAYCIRISGGKITINASGDGVDSNGDLEVSGGALYISGPESSGDSALDYDGSASVTGGIVVAAGYDGMAQNFGSESTQGSMLIRVGSVVTGKIALSDADGTVLASFTPEKGYSCVVISCPGITADGAYTVQTGTKTQSVQMDGLLYGEGMGGFNGGGFRPGGGRGGDMPDMSEMPEMPNGEMPEMPEGGFPGMQAPGGGENPPEKPGAGGKQ